MYAANLLHMALHLVMPDKSSGAWFSHGLMHRAWSEALLTGARGRIRDKGDADLSGVALGGRLRGDAAALRGASSNLAEAHDLMSAAADAAGKIASLLEEARKLAEDFLAATHGMIPGQQDYTDLYEHYQPLYRAVSRNIDKIIKNAAYKGIALLDGRAWDKGDERLSVTRDASRMPTAASVQIQAGDSSFPLTFSDMSRDFADIAGTIRLHNNADAPTALAGLRSAAQSLADLYAGRAGGLKGQSVALQSQARILEEAAAQRIRSDTPASPENLLLYLILRDAGSIFSGKG